MEHIVLRTGLRGDDALEVHGLADVGVVFLTVFAGGILLNGLFVRGDGVLFLDFGGRFVRRRSDDGLGAERGGDEIVTGIQTGEADVAIGGRVLRLQRGQPFGKRLCVLCEGRDIRAVLPAYIALVVDGDIGQARACFIDTGGSLVIGPEKVRPGGVDGIAVSGEVVIDRQIQHLVQFIRLIFDSVFHGDGVATGRERGRAQGEQHDQCQQDAGEFLRELHSFGSFLVRGLLKTGILAHQEDAVSSFPRFLW